MSGSRFFVQALPYDVHEGNYQHAMSALGLQNATSDERIKAFLETPGQDLLAKLPPSVLTAPAVDGDMVPSAVTYAQVADQTSDIPKGKQWCRDLLIGDAQYDVSGRILQIFRYYELALTFLDQHSRYPTASFEERMCRAICESRSLRLSHQARTGDTDIGRIRVDCRNYGR